EDDERGEPRRFACQRPPMPRRSAGMTHAARPPDAFMADVRQRLGERVIVLVGLMGAGKTAIGRKVAQSLDLPFIDSGHEIETVSRMSIPELFERYGEPEFRALEQRVIER